MSVLFESRYPTISKSVSRSWISQFSIEVKRAPLDRLDLASKARSLNPPLPAVSHMYTLIFDPTHTSDPPTLISTKSCGSSTVTLSSLVVGGHVDGCITFYSQHALVFCSLTVRFPKLIPLFFSFFQTRCSRFVFFWYCHFCFVVFILSPNTLIP